MARVTGMIAGIPFTDPTRVIQSLSVEYGYDPFEYWYGATLVRLWKDGVVTVGIEMENSQASGIAAPTLGGSGKLDSVTAAFSEEINGEVPKIPRYPGEEIPDNERIVMAFADAVRWLGTRVVYTINGRGTPVWAGSSQGSDVGGTVFSAASGTYSITIPTGVHVEKVSRNDTNNGDVSTWTGECNAFIPNPGSLSDNIIEIPTEVASLLPTPAVYILTNNVTMSGDLPINVKNTFNAACHLAS